MKHQSNLITGTSIALFAVLFSSVAFAQNSTGTGDNTIRIEAGQMLEIGADAESPKADFSWILTKDRKFQNAQRTTFFQLRPSQSGQYGLDVSIQNPGAGQNDYKAFTIIVTDPTGDIPTNTPSADSLKAITSTVPSMINGSVYLPVAGGIVTIDAGKSSGHITSYVLDLDGSVDSDGDGDPTNDHDTRDTYAEKSGSPLSYFMKNRNGPRTVTLTIIDAVTGQTDRVSFQVLFSPAPAGSRSQAGGIVDPNSPISIVGNDNTATFGIQLPEAQTAGKQLLTEWDFGDHSHSLLTNPVHSYATPGTYTVSVTVRDITNGQIVYQGSSAVQILGTAQISSSSSSSSSAAAGTTQSSWVGSLFKVGFIITMLLALAVGLYMAGTWIKRKTAGSLEKTFDTMEKSIVKKDAKADVTATPEPLKIKKDAIEKQLAPKQEDIADAEKSKTEFKTASRDNPVPITRSAPVPSWLAKASGTSASASKPTAAPIAQKTPAATVAPTTKPMTPAPVAPIVKPVTPVAPVATPKPTVSAQPTQVAKPVTTPTPPVAAPAPIAESKPAAPQPKPIEELKPMQKTETPKSAKKSDETIAIIQADSLSK